MTLCPSLARFVRLTAAVCCALAAWSSTARAQAAGACCTSSTTCVTMTDCQCKASGGNFLGSGIACTPQSCQNFVFGACCYTSTLTGSQNCVFTFAGNCQSLAGFAFSANQTCAAAACAPVITAACCCSDNSCTLTNPDLCGRNGSTPFLGQSCNPTPCGVLNGACCTAAGGCFLAPQSQCTGTWFNGSGCNPNPCGNPPVACCSTVGTCTIVPASQCTGTVLANFSTCQPNPCMGACCDQEGNCLFIQPGQCISPRTFMGLQVPCQPNPCLGSCCNLQTGNCAVVSQTQCTNGTWVSGGACNPNPCMGSCCNLQTGACAIVSIGVCTNGTFVPAGTCVPNPCAQPIVCCLPDGSCTLVPSPNFCNGFPIATLTSCTPSPCISACCKPDGSCSAITKAACDSANGTWNFASTCAQVICPTPQSACCTPNGVCVMLLPIICQNQNGIVIPGVCTPNTICRGACCCGSSCSITPPQSCTGTGSSFAGLGTACNAPGDFTNPCCRGDFNQSGTLSVQDIFDFLAAYFGGNLCADTNQSGSLSVQDIFDFLAAYFGGCN